MDKFVARANIDHYIDMLHNHEVPPQNRTTIHKLLLEEEDKLGHDLEQLEFAETRAAACRDRADRQRRLLDALEHSSADWVQAEKVLVNFETLAQLVNGSCQQMRRKMNGGRL